MSDKTQAITTDSNHLAGVELVPGLVMLPGGSIRKMLLGGVGVGAREAGGDHPAGLLSDHPPCGITGDKVPTPPGTPPVTLKVDWIQTTHPLDRMEALAGYVSCYLGEAEKSDQGARMFPHGAYRWPSKGVLAWNNDTGRCWLSLNGESVNMIGAGNWRVFLQELYECFAGRGCRIDLAADFWSRPFTLDDVQQAAESGNFRKFQTTEVRSPLKRRAGRMTKEGHMITFGRRGGEGKGVYLRFYDKGLESKGQHNSQRFEAEISGELARIWLESLASSRDDASLARKISGGLVDFVDFVERGNHRNADRMKRLAWWCAAVELLGKPWKLTALHVTPSVERKMVWLKQQVAPTLAYVEAFCDSLGVPMPAMLEAVLREGRDRINWTRRHRIDQDFNPATVFPALPALACTHS